MPPGIVSEMPEPSGSPFGRDETGSGFSPSPALNVSGRCLLHVEQACGPGLSLVPIIHVGGRRGPGARIVSGRPVVWLACGESRVPDMRWRDGWGVPAEATGLGRDDIFLLAEAALCPIFWAGEGGRVMATPGC